ncbi:F-box/kelch-repeat protein At3g06240-like [Papaver somniferum]|uniref:F-box/kelch-repeat protein At3g06240-like n=1 Tax=Papaver somniferum TaxID=3469 RepID=UPI000E6F9475|nr:F-box/kelch-repeat protein At3g06240-like [Papaver somniferum]
MLFARLTEEVQADVFLKLPLKSIGKCRCVCKLWRNLLCSSGFVKYHLDSSMQSDNPRLMITATMNHKQDVLYSIDYASTLSSASLSIKTINNKSSCASSRACECKEVVRMYYPFEYDQGGGSVHILGSCNGLICLATSNYPFGSDLGYRICIWNPSTREYKKILSDIEFKYRYRYGFGYDQNIDDYKVVSILEDIEKPGYFQAQVYAIKSDTWTTIQSIPYLFPFRGIQFPSVLFDGALHWLGVTTTKETNSEVIVSFDISNDRFRDVGIPEEAMTPPIGVSSGKNLGVVRLVRDCPCLAVRISCMCYVFWVMQDYGVKESWTKQFNIAQETIAKYDFWNSKPIWFLKNGRDTDEYFCRFCFIRPKE